MRCVATAIALTVALPLLWLPPSAAHAQAPTSPERRILFDYYEPRNPDFASLYESLQKRRVLEELSEFLSPVKWPKKLRLIIKECPATGTPTPEVFYSSIEYSLTICYQWFAALEKLDPPEGYASQQEVIVGGLLGIVLHEAGRAMFDLLKVPRLGSESDAADQLSAFIGLQFGDEVARVVIKGTYFVWKNYDDEIVLNNRQYNFATRTSVPRQRMYNTLCIAYGGAPAVFKNFVDQGDLLSRRAERCPDEYRQVLQAFQKTVLPHLDQGLMSKVRSTKWLTADDLK